MGKEDRSERREEQKVEEVKRKKNKGIKIRVNGGKVKR